MPRILAGCGFRVNEVRLLEMRHSYAVAALRRLDADGTGLYSEMPVLSTYMGHENLYGGTFRFSLSSGSADGLAL